MNGCASLGGTLRLNPQSDLTKSLHDRLTASLLVLSQNQPVDEFDRVVHLLNIHLHSLDHTSTEIETPVLITTIENVEAHLLFEDVGKPEDRRQNRRNIPGIGEGAGTPYVVSPAVAHSNSPASPSTVKNTKR